MPRFNCGTPYATGRERPAGEMFTLPGTIVGAPYDTGTTKPEASNSRPELSHVPAGAAAGAGGFSTSWSAAGSTSARQSSTSLVQPQIRHTVAAVAAIDVGA